MTFMNRNDDTLVVATAGINEHMLAAMSIRDLIAAYPATMEMLAPLGIDLCCGGAHPLGEALDLHGIARADVLPAIALVVTAAGVGGK
jgi:iron-sulfur cluster repair protein YtfE (RIC family)